MAKSKLEKLVEAISAAVKIHEEAEVGEGEGQFSQSTFDEFSLAIETAKAVSEISDVEPSVYEEGSNVLLKAVDTFKAAKNKPDEETKSPAETSETKTTMEIKGVVLPQWPSDQKGIHTIHLKERIITFIDGKAELPSNLVDELKKAGYLE